MTSGSSQGLFVIVAVVIFGIFVSISYVLFGDKMSTGLTDIFEESFFQVSYMLAEDDVSTGGDKDNNKFQKSHTFRQMDLNIGNVSTTVKPTDTNINLKKSDFTSNPTLESVTFGALKVEDSSFGKGFDKEKQGFSTNIGVNGQYNRSEYLSKYDSAIKPKATVDNLTLKLDLNKSNTLEINIINHYGGVSTFKYTILFK